MSQNTLHVRCQLLHVPAPRCHLQGVYQQRRIVPTRISGAGRLATHKSLLMLKPQMTCHINRYCISSATQLQQRHTATSLLCVTSTAIYCIVYYSPDTRCVAASVGVHSDITHNFTHFYMHIHMYTH